MIRIVISCFFLLINSSSIYGQDTTRMKSLVVYGDQFTYSLDEPDNWIGDIASAPTYHSNIIFYKNEGDLNNEGVVIQVSAFKKQDENTNEDLNYDIKTYEKNYQNIEQKDLTVYHKEYKCFSKLVFKENDFYHYIAYINPGEKFPFGLSITMNVSKREAGIDEFNAYLSIIASLWMVK